MLSQQVAVLLLVAKLVCGGVVGGEWRQGTGLACDETLNLDFSGPEPQVDCSSPCEDSVKTWSAGPLFRREARLTEQGYMVRQEYRQDGTITCSLVRDMPETQDLQSALQSEACASTPVASTTIPGGSTTTPVTGGSTPTPVTGESTPTPVTGDSTPTPVTGESTPTPVTGESTPIPVTGESTPIPVTGESTPTPVTGESTPIPVTGGSTPTPVTGESTPTPVTGESTPIPVTGESTPIPVTGGSTPTPVTGGSTPTPVTGGSTLTTVPVSSSEVTELSSTVTSEATTLIECVKGGEVDSTKPQTITDEPTTTTTESPWVCEAGWKLHGASCYHVDNDITLDWVKGQYFCLGKNADYVKITTNDELQFLRGLVTYDTWIGLEDRNTEGMFRWTDNSVPVFKGWHDGEPNNFENEDCTEMRKSKDFFWNDSKCSNLKRVLCQKHATKAA